MRSRTVDAVILAGGKGTRLEPVLSGQPKPMASISGKPFLEILVEYLKAQGIQRFIFSVGHLAEKIEDYFRFYLGIESHFVREDEPRGTAGALKLAEPFFQSNPVLVLNGDSFCPCDFESFLDFHIKKLNIASLLAVPADRRRDGGYIKIDENGRILSFREKDYFPTALTSAGIYLFSRSFFDKIPSQTFCSLEKDIFPFLEQAYAFRSDERLYDIGTPERLKNFRLLYPQQVLKRQASLR